MTKSIQQSTREPLTYNRNRGGYKKLGEELLMYSYRTIRF